MIIINNKYNINIYKCKNVENSIFLKHGTPNHQQLKMDEIKTSSMEPSSTKNKQKNSRH